MITEKLGHGYKEWTHRGKLPGGDLDGAEELTLFIEKQWQKYPWLPQGLLLRYAQSYGSMMNEFLLGAESIKDLGISFGGGLYQREVDYLVQKEFAKTAEDILWRRSKLGLLKNKELQQKLEKYLSGENA